MVSLCLCQSDDKAEGKVVLSTLHSGKKEETIAAYKPVNVVCKDVIISVLDRKSLC